MDLCLFSVCEKISAECLRALTNDWEDYGLDMYVCVWQVCTIPLDTAKVRLQLQGKALAGEVNVVPKYRGMVGTIATIAREEGTMSLWRGIVPGLHRQILFGGLRIGLYEPVCFSHLAFLPHHIPLFVSYVHNKWFFWVLQLALDFLQFSRRNLKLWWKSQGLWTSSAVNSLKEKGLILCV